MPPSKLNTICSSHLFPVVPTVTQLAGSTNKFWFSGGEQCTACSHELFQQGRATPQGDYKVASSFSVVTSFASFFCSFEFCLAFCPSEYVFSSGTSSVFFLTAFFLAASSLLRTASQSRGTSLCQT